MSTTNLFEAKCLETVQRVLFETRNKPDIEVQQALIKAFPFSRANLPAWKVYGKEIYRQSKRKMF